MAKPYYSGGSFLTTGWRLMKFRGMACLRWLCPLRSSRGKYRVKINSGNGIFLRTVEQQVLVYPPPMRASFIQGRGRSEPHQVVVETEEGGVVARLACCPHCPGES